ncbi:metallophosphoesterase [Clostridium drakei]|uniref:Calcineurin-like phosphoesterase domain-containing protein n=1 Tax=Clostridium drakei TaxID=332101 RepID=A0A2U8DVC1_9CLOT|nr:metallophosphoesterase [Clostridium drakei]AWI06736.1 hypothetical protein B9W14_20295 [Clostridium drakei]
MLIIGDIHGQLSILKKLLENVKDDNIYFVGDLIDRGIHGVETLQYVKNKKYKIVLGNHEAMMLKYLESKKEWDKQLWFDNGGQETLFAYNQLSDQEQGEILCFIKRLPYYFYIDDIDILISHSGVNANAYFLKDSDANKADLKTLLNIQEPKDYLWSRHEEFIFNDNLKEYSTVFVAGHTITKKIDFFIDEPKVLRFDNRFLIDCGAFNTGTLGSIKISDNNVKAHYYSDEKGYYVEDLGKLR